MLFHIHSNVGTLYYFHKVSDARKRRGQLVSGAVMRSVGEGTKSLGRQVECDQGQTPAVGWNTDWHACRRRNCSVDQSRTTRSHAGAGASAEGQARSCPGVQRAVKGGQGTGLGWKVSPGEEISPWRQKGRWRGWAQQGMDKEPRELLKEGQEHVEK